jgi:hypothetical protein
MGARGGKLCKAVVGFEGATEGIRILIAKYFDRNRPTAETSIETAFAAIERG